MAEAGKGLSERGVQAESVERRIRRIENDHQIEVATCFEPLVKELLAHSRIDALWLIVDPSFQEDRVVMVSVNVWYRGRSLPLVWATWPANQPLEGDGFWQRVAELAAAGAKALLPAGIPVTVLADRAFGTPAFTDLVEQQGWHWIVRVQGQTRCRDRLRAGAVHRPVGPPARRPAQAARSGVQKSRLARGQCGGLLGPALPRARCVWSVICPRIGPASPSIAAASRLSPPFATGKPMAGAGSRAR